MQKEKKEMKEQKESDNYQQQEDEIELTGKEHCKIAIVGNVDSGKSTLVGVLTKGVQDDGRGLSRSKVLNFPHEIESGRTSSIGQEIMGFDETGTQYIPKRFNQNKNKYWNEVVTNSKKIMTMCDLCGHEKYLKTTMFGLTALIPDYVMIIVGLNTGIQRMTKEHLGITIALKIPFLVVLTKVDLCPKNIYDETLNNLKNLMKNKYVNKLPVEITDKTTPQEIASHAEKLYQNNICPIFVVSNVSMQGIPPLISFIAQLQNRDKDNPMIKRVTDPFEFDIHEHFNVTGCGIVVSGIVRSGRIGINDEVLLGPDKQQEFKKVYIKGIHLSRKEMSTASVGEMVTFNIKPVKAGDKINRNEFRKGMVLLDKTIEPQCSFEFEAQVNVLHHATTIQTNYQSVMHCGVIRQAVAIKNMFEKERLVNGDHGLCRFRFMYSAEYLKQGQTVLFREGRTKILGQITRVLTEQELQEEDKIEKEKIKQQNLFIAQEQKQKQQLQKELAAQQNGGQNNNNNDDKNNNSNQIEETKTASIQNQKFSEDQQINQNENVDSKIQSDLPTGVLEGTKKKYYRKNKKQYQQDKNATTQKSNGINEGGVDNQKNTSTDQNNKFQKGNFKNTNAEQNQKQNQNDDNQ